MNKDLLKKIKAYSLAAGAVVAVSSEAEAQVAHSGTVNETVTSSFLIDIDGDGVNDYNIGINTWSSTSTSNSITYTYYSGFFYINPLVGSNELLSTGGSYLVALSSSETVSSGLSIWNYNSNNLNLGYTYYGSVYNSNFIGQGDKFIGVKFDIDGNTHYGWIRVNVESGLGNSQITVVDWAYEQTPDASIMTGDTGTPPQVTGISIANIAATTADLLFTPNVDGSAFYVVLLESDAAPNADEVLAGTGSGGASVVESGYLSVTSSNEATFNITGLTAGTSYTAYLVLDDFPDKTLSTVYDTDFSSSASINKLLDAKFDIYPNPSNGIFQIKSKLNHYSTLR